MRPKKIFRFRLHLLLAITTAADLFLRRRATTRVFAIVLRHDANFRPDADLVERGNLTPFPTARFHFTVPSQAPGRQ